MYSLALVSQLLTLISSSASSSSCADLTSVQLKKVRACNVRARSDSEH